jgi:hypothetical protein
MEYGNYSDARIGHREDAVRLIDEMTDPAKLARTDSADYAVQAYDLLKLLKDAIVRGVI